MGSLGEIWFGCRGLGSSGMNWLPRQCVVVAMAIMFTLDVRCCVGLGLENAV